jgi:transcription elongation factor S-II
MTFDVFLDKTRDKCMELIYDALCSDSSARAFHRPSPRMSSSRPRTASDVIFERARAIEEGTYAGNGHQCSAAYKSKMRSLYLNLKDKANPALRASLVAGDLAADKLWSMSPQELASEERRKHDREIKDANLFESLGAAAQASETDMFMCVLGNVASTLSPRLSAPRSGAGGVSSERCVAARDLSWRATG